MPRPHRNLPAHRAMIVAPQPEAVEAGHAILAAGGSAVDAALACAFTQGVVDQFGVLPEREFAKTPFGIIYSATSRVGDNIWARMVDNVLPNLQQVAPIRETGQEPHPFSGPMMSRWIVPIDDTYEESQRRPGDFEAQVSRRPVAIHGLEHLGTTDRGITMFRNQLRRDIRAVKAGHDPVGLFRDKNVVIPTCCNDTVVRVPPAKTPELDKKRLRETGRRLAQGYIDAPPLMAAAK